MLAVVAARHPLPDGTRTRFPEYIQNLMKAEKMGNAAEHPACVDIISGIATCLAKNTTRGRVLNENGEAVLRHPAQ